MIGRRYEARPLTAAGNDYEIVAVGTGEGAGDDRRVATMRDVTQAQADAHAAYMQKRYDELRQIPIS